MKDPKTVLIFYSSIGNGHISAAQAIQREILRRSPSVQVVLQDIRAFMNPVWSKIDERLFWFLAKHLPVTFESLFLALQQQGSTLPSLALLPNDYPQEKVLEFIERHSPAAVLATHYGAAQVLGTLREKELLSDTRIGWLHTDFFEGYFPRISKRIDCTFLAHEELATRWRNAGVPEDKVVTTGMPVVIPCADPVPCNSTLAKLQFSPGTRTVLLTGGKEGVVDFCRVLESIASDVCGPMQVIAVCGLNSSQKDRLLRLRSRLPDKLKLAVFGLVSHDEMMSFMQAADLLITKSGGLTPSEAFAMGKPTLLLDVVSGHERENALMFERLGLAALVSNPTEVGRIAADVLSNSDRLTRMLEAQSAFRDSICISKIAKFALDDSFVPIKLPPDFGAENGSPVRSINEVLSKVDEDSAADVELLLSYSTSKVPQRIVTENPFGHIAIRIGETVFSANHLAQKESAPNLLQHMNLADYLYGVTRPSSSQIHTNTYGMAYGRETVGLRVQGVSSDRLQQMFAEAEKIEREFQSGSLRWDRAKYNCADVVAQILRAGGYDLRPRPEWLTLPTMPLDVFENARAIFENSASAVDLVAYRQVPGAKAEYHFSRFPLSLERPLRSTARSLNIQALDSLERAITKQVVAYFGDPRLSVDNLRVLKTPPSLLCMPHLRAERGLGPALVTDLRRLLAVSMQLSWGEMERLGSMSTSDKTRRLVERSQDIARRITESADSIRVRIHMQVLTRDYEQVGESSLLVHGALDYFKRLREFESASLRKFIQLRFYRRTKAVSRSLQRRARYLRAR